MLRPPMAKELQKDTGFGRGISDATTAEAPDLEDLETLEDEEERPKRTSDGSGGLSLSHRWYIYGIIYIYIYI